MEIEDFFQLGSQFLALGDKDSAKNRECLKRCGVSRLYYYLFLKAEAVALDHGYERPGEDEKQSTHAKLWNWFAANGHKEIRHRAQRMKKKRVQADYYPYEPFTADTTEFIKEVREIAELINGY